MHDLAAYLAAHEFKSLFIEALGWDTARGSMTAASDGRVFRFDLVAHKRGLQVLQCAADKYTLFNRHRLRELQKQLLRSAHEHVIIYTCDDPKKQVWQWAVRLPNGQRLRHREHPFFSSSPPEKLLGRLHEMRFALEDEERLTLLDAVDRVRLALDTEADSNLFVHKPRYAEKSDQLALSMRNGGAEAYREFATFHLLLASWGARRWHRYFGDLDDEDRAQIAVIGLLEAARRFEPARGYQFSTYANHWIRSACQTHGPACANLIRVPRNVLGHCWAIRARLNRLLARGHHDSVSALLGGLEGRSPTIAECWGQFCAATSVGVFSDVLDRQVADVVLVDDREDDPLVPLIRAETDAAVREAVEALSPGDAQSIRLRYGFQCEPQTLDQIGERLGRTKEGIRQRLARAEEKLRVLLAERLSLPLPRQQIGDASSAEVRDMDAAQKTLLAQIRGHPAGVSAILLAERVAMTRYERLAALRALLQRGRIVQNGSGRKTIYRLAAPAGDEPVRPAGT